MREWLPSGTMIARYQISSRLSASGTGEVYLARDITAGREVALKILPSSLIKDQFARKKFLKIYAHLARFEHIGVCKLYEAGLTETLRPYVAMEYIKGQSLDVLGYGQQLTFSENIAVILQMADALEAAHSHGWLHLSIRPSNLMVTPDRDIKILDFGQSLAFPPSMSPEAEEPFQVTLGHVRYYSPEQVAEERPDQRCDIFSLGSVLYEMIAAHTPFVGATVDEVIAGITLADPLPLTEFREDLPEEFNRIVMKALAKDPVKRYQTAAEFAFDLRELTSKESFWTKLGSIEPDELIKDSFYQPQKTRSKALPGLFQGFFMTKRSRDEQGSGAPGGFLADLKKAFTGLGSKSLKSDNRVTAGINRIPQVRGEAPFLDSLINYFKYYNRRLLAASLVVVGLLWASWIASFLWGQATESQKNILSKNTFLTAVGNVKSAVISPDAVVLVYVVQEGTQEGLKARNLRSHTEFYLAPPELVEYKSLSISPDGKWVAYIKTEPNQDLGVSCRRPIQGGVEEVLSRSKRLSAVDFSSHSDNIAFIQQSPDRTETQLMIGAINGPFREVIKHKSPSFIGNGVLSWSPDERLLACAIKEYDNNPYFRLAIVDIATGRENHIVQRLWSIIESVEWITDGSGLIVVATEPTSRFSQIWKIDYPTGNTSRITFSQSTHKGVSLVANSTGIVTVSSKAISNIWVAASGDLNKVRQVSADKYDGVDGLAWSSDNRLLFSSRAGGRDSIWITQSSLINQIPLDISPEGGDSGEYQPSVSPDGGYIAYIVERQGGAYLWQSEISRRVIKRISDENLVFFPSFSADGKEVIYSVLRDGRRQIARISINGGIPVTIIEKQAWRPVLSPDGSKIACNYWDEIVGVWKLAVFNYNGAGPLFTFEAPGDYNRTVKWMPDGNSLAYIVTHGGVSNIWIQNLDGSAPRPLTDFKKNLIFDFAWSRDGKSIAYAQGWYTSDVLLIQNFRNPGDQQSYLSRRSE